MKRVRKEEGDEVDVGQANSNCLMLLSKVGEISYTNPSKERVLRGPGGFFFFFGRRPGGFKCKTCSRQFLSFQALGGHRARHKKLKQPMDTGLSSSPTSTKPKMHLCPICGLEFAIGQALGGHMRKHRAALNDHAGPISSKGTTTTTTTTNKRFHLRLDLNLTP